MKNFKKILLGSLIALSANANAELIQTDLHSVGDGQIAFDTNTGIEWLKLPLTYAKSLEDIELMIGEGGEYEGFRIATYAELLTMFKGTLSNNDNDFEVSITDVEKHTHYEEENIYKLLPLGLQGPFDQGYRINYYSHIFTKEKEHDYGDRVDLYGSIYLNPDDFSHLIKQNIQINSYQRYSSVGFALISDGGLTYSSLNDEFVQNIQSNLVPLGSSSILLGLGLAGLGLRRKMK